MRRKGTIRGVLTKQQPQNLSANWYVVAADADLRQPHLPTLIEPGEKVERVLTCPASTERPHVNCYNLYLARDF